MQASKILPQRTTHAPPGRKRSRFGPDRRREVEIIRRKGACLRCSMLRIPCSPDDICVSCQQLAVHAHQRHVLTFSGCIRTSTSEASVFEFYLPPPGDNRDNLSTKIEQLSQTTISLEFSSLLTWDLSFLVNDVVNWLNSSTNSETSKVGTLSSPRFLDLIRPFVEESTTNHFQRMVYAISLAHVRPDAPDNHQVELIQIGSIAGHKFLASLDKLLKPQQLKDCSKDHLQSLFLMVLGTILAAGYTRPPVLNSTSVTLDYFQNTRDFLCQILAHYLLYLGSQLKLSIGKETEQFILQASPARWHKQGLFQWTTTPHVESSLYTQDVEKNLNLEDMSEFDWLASSGMITYDSDQISNDPVRPRIRNHQTAQDSSILQQPRKANRSARPNRDSTCRTFNSCHGYGDLSIPSFEICATCGSNPRLIPKCMECRGAGFVRMLVPMDGLDRSPSMMASMPSSDHFLV